MTAVGEDSGTVASAVSVGTSTLSVGGSLSNGSSFNGVLTALAAPGVPVQVAGTWSLAYSNGFSSPANGVLRCDVGGLYKISTSGLVTNALINTTHDILLLLNGTATTAISINSLAQIYSAIGMGTFSSEMVASLAVGDQLTLAMGTAVAPSNPRVRRYAITVVKL